jgi:hypothetical protein
VNSSTSTSTIVRAEARSSATQAAEPVGMRGPRIAAIVSIINECVQVGKEAVDQLYSCDSGYVLIGLGVRSKSKCLMLFESWEVQV